MPVLLQVRDLKSRSLDVDFHEVSWVLANTSEDVLDYSFQVLRSESPSGPFDPLSTSFDDRYVFIDNVVQIANRWRKYFYVLRVTQKRSGDSQDFGPITNDPDPDLIAKELRRHMQLLLREFAGRRAWVLPARTFGQRCECWSETMQKRTRSGCRLCYDTGFVRGFMSPIEVWMQIDPSPKATQQTNVGEQQQSNTSARVGYYPPLKPRDLIIEPENRRWRVTQVSMTEHGRAPIHQELQLHEIPATDIEFAIPLNLDGALKDLWLNPSRNYTNPTSLENFEDSEVPRIFGLYPMPRQRL